MLISDTPLCYTALEGEPFRIGVWEDPEAEWSVTLRPALGEHFWAVPSYLMGPPGADGWASAGPCLGRSPESLLACASDTLLFSCILSCAPHALQALKARVSSLPGGEEVSAARQPEEASHGRKK